MVLEVTVTRSDWRLLPWRFRWTLSRQQNLVSNGPKYL